MVKDSFCDGGGHVREYRMGNKLTKEKIKKEHRGNLHVRRVISIIFLNVWMDDTEH